LFHWVLAAGAAVEAWSGFVGGPTRLRLHLLAGGVVVASVVFRVLWGRLGPTYARFCSFVFPPRSVWRHLRGGEEADHFGHNPVGALMVFALLGVIALLAGTGTVTLGGRLKQGPLAAFTSFSLGQQTLAIHRSVAILLLGMIGLHLSGVAVESWRLRENLALAMLTGRKRARRRAPAPREYRARTWLALSIWVGSVGCGAAALSGLAALPRPGVPPDRLDARYVAACGACHMPYPPVLLTSVAWASIMRNLGRHFGEDASLDSGGQAIAAYLRDNAAEHWDSLPAHVFRSVDAGAAPAITTTPAWRRLHRGIPAAVFAAPSVASKSACQACHADAMTGRFAPQDIDIPREALP
jgi:cytochrome b